MHVHKKTPLLFIRQLPDRRFCSDKGFFHTLRTRRKKIQEKEKKEEKKKEPEKRELPKKAEADDGQISLGDLSSFGEAA